jgi:hypothetical protein
MESSGLLAGQSSVWAQPDGPNTEPKYLGCHSVADIAQPKGDETLLYCPDPAKAGKFKVKSSFKGEPGVITTTIDTDLRKTADFLEDLSEGGCKFPFFVHKVSCGRRDVFSNYDRSFIFPQASITNAKLGKLASRNPADEGESTQSFDISDREVMRIFNLEMARISISEVEQLNSISICGEERCEGECGQKQKPEDSMFIATNHLTGSVSASADLLNSLNGGAWSVVTADPFVGGEDIAGVVCFKMGRNTTRILVARGTTDAGNTAEIAYSDDGGATWTSVDVGSTIGEYVKSGHALQALDQYHIWLGTDGGRIYFSADGGVTWTKQEDAVISSSDVMGLSMVDEEHGFVVYTGGQIASTGDGETWSAKTVSGSAVATDIHALSEYFVWVSGTDGLFYSMDGGDTWASRDTKNIAAIDFLNELFGIFVEGSASGGVYVTINGGYSWDALPAVTNSGYTDVKIISTKLAYVLGKVSNATGFLGKISPA